MSKRKKRKHSKEFKLELIRQHEEDGISYYKLEKDNDLAFGTIRHWHTSYKSYGEDGLVRCNSMLCRYSAEFKKKVVAEYLEGGISTLDLAMKHGIHAESTVAKWIKLYNSHEELTDSRPEGGMLLMANDIKPRKTTREERIKIVEHCIAHSNNYALTAKEFSCSYGQVYSWVRKYNEKGIDGLKDGRGRNKNETEMSEIERLRVENRLLRAEKKRQQMEIDLLKKLEDIERR